jgi:hypothetical protein
MITKLSVSVSCFLFFLLVVACIVAACSKRKKIGVSADGELQPINHKNGLKNK